MLAHHTEGCHFSDDLIAFIEEEHLRNDRLISEIEGGDDDAIALLEKVGGTAVQPDDSGGAGESIGLDARGVIDRPNVHEFSIAKPDVLHQVVVNLDAPDVLWIRIRHPCVVELTFEELGQSHRLNAAPA